MLQLCCDLNQDKNACFLAYFIFVLFFCIMFIINFFEIYLNLFTKKSGAAAPDL